MLPVAVARSSSDGVAIRYVLPVLRMTSCFHTVKPIGKIKRDVMFRRVRQVAVPVGRQTTVVFLEFVRMQLGGGGVCYLELPKFVSCFNSISVDLWSVH